MKRTEKVSGIRPSTVILFGLLLLGLLAGSGPAGAVISAGAAPENLDVLLDHVQKHYQSTRSFRAKFDETITRPGAPPIRRSGVIYYEKPGKLRWDFEGSQPET